MSRSSPGVGRVVAILNFFADHPGQAFTLTDLVRSLKISRATCHALLAGLVDAGYLYRTSDKSYVLGPALAAIGRIANDHFSPLQVARPEMRALADEFDAICSAVFREGDEAVVRERAASVSHLGWTSDRHMRAPIRPPFGGIFYAWAPEQDVEAWLDRVSPKPDSEQRAAMRDSLRFVREHGYGYGFRKVHVRDDRHAQELRFSEEQTAYLVADIDPEREYELAFVTAPVFDARRRVAFILGLVGFIAPVKGSEVERIGQRLRQVCDRITGFIAGQI